MSVWLETQEGGYVGTAKIPPFELLPDVLVWGSRVFILWEWQNDQHAPIYREGLAWIVQDVKEDE